MHCTMTFCFIKSKVDLKTHLTLTVCALYCKISENKVKKKVVSLENNSIDFQIKKQNVYCSKLRHACKKKSHLDT